MKQLLEILILKGYINDLCGILKNGLKERHDLQKNKLSIAYANLSIVPSNEEGTTMGSLSHDLEHLSKEYERLDQNVDEITQNIIKDFFKNTMGNTIKQPCHKKSVASFVDNPTIEQFEVLCDNFATTNWKSFVHQQTQALNEYYQTRGIDETFDDNLTEPLRGHPAKHFKRMHHSDKEKLRVKQKTGCKCIGLPTGLSICPNFGTTLSHTMLTH